MNRSYRFALLFFSVVLLFPGSFAQNPDHSVFQISDSKTRKWILYQDNDQWLYRTIAGDAFDLLEQRQERIARLKTKADWEVYRQELRDRFYLPMKKFEKTPLNARITGTIQKKTYRVEKVLFESHPGFYVTAALFIPKKRQRPAPAIVYLSGHTALAFRDPTYQHIILNLVDKGFIVFAVDPIGQGERLQYVDGETNRSKIGGPTTEHSYAGAQTLLTGTSLSDYFVWDGVRAIDYLATRKEVDIHRIGMTGRSGGGTQTAMIAAYDERVYAAAPECYITSFKRLLQSIGPQDAEQNPWHALALGFDHADFLHLRAPGPTLIITTTNDFFSQQGARETFAEAKKSFAALGHPENIRMVTDFGIHTSTKKNRERMYAFFQRALKVPGDSTDRDVEVFRPEELWVTKTGQVGTSLKGKTVYDLNRQYFRKEQIAADQLRGKIKEISGVAFDRHLTTAVYSGEIPGDTFVITKYFLENNRDDYALPVWVVQSPGKKTEKVLVWLTPGGKAKILENKMLPQFLRAGYTIVSADLPGTGELRDPEFRGDGFVENVPFNYTFGAQLSGKSVTGIQADALDLLMQFVAERNKGGVRTDAFVEREMSVPFLHYAVFSRAFARMVLVSPLTSYESLIREKYYDPQWAFYVPPGSLPWYDFSDLLAFLPENSYRLVNPLESGNEKGRSGYDTAQVLDFLEQPGYPEENFPPELVRWKPYDKGPLFTGTGAATWDKLIRERGFILKEDGIYKMWYSGYNPDSTEEIHLGYATSPDGIHWSRYPGNPIYKKGWVEDMFVLHQGDTYYMFAEGLHDVAHMLISHDGIHWQEKGSLDIRTTRNGKVPGPYGTPTVWVEKGIWYLFYERNDLGIWLATSTDLKVWKNISDDPVIAMGPEPYDKYAVAMDQVIRYKGKYYGFYHANIHDPWTRVGWNSCIAVSDDLVHWKKYPGNPLVNNDRDSPIVVWDGTQYRLYTMHPGVYLFMPEKK